jgi:hypothetical protein
MAGSPLRSKDGFEHQDNGLGILDASGIDLTSTGLSATTGSVAQKLDGTFWIKFGAASTDWEEAGSNASDISALSAAIDNNTTNISTVSGDVITNTTDISTISGDVITNTGDIVTISGDLATLSAAFDGHTHTKSEITDFVESDYVHTTGAESISGLKTFVDDVTINGDLFVNGTTTTISSETVLVEDNIITLNNGEPGAGVTAVSAGLEIDRGTEANVFLRWNETTDTWQVTEDGTVFYDILNSGNNSNVGILSAGNYVVGTDVATDLLLLDAGLTTVSGDLDTLETTVGTLSSGNYIIGTEVAEDLVELDDNLFALSAEVSAIVAPTSIAVDGVTTITTIDSVAVDDYGAIKWLVTYVDETNDKRNANEIFAVHNGQTNADADSVDFTDYAFIKAPAIKIPGITIDVDISGTGGSQVMRLRMTSASVSVNVRATRIEVAI